jgi:hypothetical protein
MFINNIFKKLFNKEENSSKSIPSQVTNDPLAEQSTTLSEVPVEKNKQSRTAKNKDEITTTLETVSSSKALKKKKINSKTPVIKRLKK